MTGEYKNSNQITRAGVRWAIGIIVTAIIALWGMGYAISVRGIDKREKMIEKNTDSIVVIKERQAAMAESIKNIDKTTLIILREIRGNRNIE